MTRIHVALAFGVALATTATAHAQSAGNMQLDEFRPAMDSRGFLTLNGTSVLGSEEVSFGLGSLEWGRHLLAFSNGSSTYSVDNVVTGTLVGAMGLQVAGLPFEVGASLPVSLIDGTQGRVDGQGIGDAGLHLKARVLQAGAFGLAGLASVYLPTASPKNSFLGEPGVTPQFLALADVKLGRLRVAANGGVRLRPTETFTDTMMGTMGTVTTSTELPYGAALAWAFVPDKLEAIAEVYGAIPVGPHQNYRPLEALGGVKVYLAKNSYLSIGAGRGLIAQQGNPDLRAMIGIVFEPKAAASRRVIVPDDTLVAQGPPPKPATDDEADRDGDGVYDKDDKCPDEPGPAWNQGCPDRETVIDQGSELVVLKSIDFEYDSAKLKESSYPVLDAVVKALVDNPDIRLVEVQGHTDERGSADYNLDLSNRRAASVMAYLVDKGIVAKRLTSRGYGKTKPIDSSHTEAAWAKNRRVEFIIEDRDAK